MNFILKNVKEKDLHVFEAQAKRLGFEIEIVDTENKSIETDN